MSVEFQKTIPILRIFSVEKAKRLMQETMQELKVR